MFFIKPDLMIPNNVFASACLHYNLPLGVH